MGSKDYLNLKGSLLAEHFVQNGSTGFFQKRAARNQNLTPVGKISKERLFRPIFWQTFS